MVSTQMFCSDGALQRSDPDLPALTSGAGGATGVRFCRFMKWWGVVPLPSHRLSPYKSLQLHSIQEDLAQATRVGEGTDLGQ